MMTFADISSGSAVFLDANTLVYHFIRHAQFGPACSDLLDRIERGDVHGHTSAHVVGEMAHRLMTHEACGLFGWPAAGIAQRLKRHPAEVQRLGLHRQALDEITLIGINVLAVAGGQVSLAADVGRQFGLLSNDALIVVVMRDYALSLLASHDADFDRVPGLTRYAPV